MKRNIVTLTLLAAIQLVSAQEKLPREEALTYAQLVSADPKQLAGTPITTDVDAQQPVALRDGEYGGMVLPQKNLKAETLAKAGESVIPIGQLWLLKLTPMVDGSGIPGDKLRLVTVKRQGEDYTVPQCALGVRRTSAGTLELLVFGKGKEPVVTAPLTAIDTKSEAPLDVSAIKTDDGASVTLKILGKYEAKLMVTGFEP
jgi:hypothetical protein